LLVGFTYHLSYSYNSEISYTTASWNALIYL